MRSFLVALASVAISQVAALGTSCSAALTPQGSASSPYWLHDIAHLGTSAFNANPGSYQVFRNVLNFGATGNGKTSIVSNEVYGLSNARGAFFYQVLLMILQLSTAPSPLETDAVEAMDANRPPSLLLWSTSLLALTSSALLSSLFTTLLSSETRRTLLPSRPPLASRVSLSLVSYDIAAVS